MSGHGPLVLVKGPDDRLGCALMADETLICMVEIPMGSRNKYEYDPNLKAIRFDRFVSAAVVYPTDYGFIPETLALDGDELDVLVCVSEPTFPGCLVPVNPIGLFCMTDENGPDNKVVCVPVHDPRWNVYDDIEDLPLQLRNEIFHFFTVYKDLDADRHSEPAGWQGRAEAQREIAGAQERHRAQAHS
jgi:inorganic pyrophosphatase